MSNEVATDVTMTNAQAAELEAVEEPWQKLACRRRQLEAIAVDVCRHGTPIDERCWLCEPFKRHLFPPREDRR